MEECDTLIIYAVLGALAEGYLGASRAVRK